MSAPDLYVATLGAAGSGQSTLADALVLRQDRRFPTDPRDEAQHGVRGVSYRSERRRYRHVDCAGHSQHMRYLLAQEPIPDGVIVVAGADVGVTAELRDQLMVASKVGVPRAVAFLSKTDLATDVARLDAVERDVRQALADADYPADDVPVVRGDLLVAKASRGEDDQACACADALVEAMEAAIPTPEKPWRAGLLDDPFLMAVEDVFFIKGRGTVVTGDIKRGRVKIGDSVEIVGLRADRIRTEITGIEMINTTTPRAPDSIGVLIPGVERSDVRRGQVLAAPGSITAHNRFEAVIFLLDQVQGGTAEAISPLSPARFTIHHSAARVQVTLPAGRDRCGPGEWTTLTAALPSDRALALEPGLTFAVGRAQGFGRVTRILE